MTNKTKITMARGDGIGPEIMDATLEILDKAGAALDIEEIKIGKDVYESGVTSGIPDEAWDSLRSTKIFLKAPITTPQGGGYKSLNVTIRKTLGLFANVRPCVSYAPYVATFHPNMDIVIVRENEEDLYGGIEYRPSADVTEAVKIITKPASERIIRYAFEYAKAYGRQKVTCMSKDNIMKISDGLFHKTFDEVAKDYPEIENDHMIIDIGTAKVASAPQMFDVIVMPNLYGDVVSDVAAEVTGSVGLGGSSNIGADFAMFEAVHGSAPDIAGKGIANPSGLLLGAVMMLVHIGQNGVAETIHNAWMRTIEDGIHTGDIHRTTSSKQLADTKTFTQAVIERLGQAPKKLKKAEYQTAAGTGMEIPQIKISTPQEKSLVGVDVFVSWDGQDAAKLAEEVKALAGDAFTLSDISNRGTKVWPNVKTDTFLCSSWRLRFMGTGAHAKHQDVIALLGRFCEADMDFAKMEHLYDYDGEPGYSAAQG